MAYSRQKMESWISLDFAIHIDASGSYLVDASLRQSSSDSADEIMRNVPIYLRFAELRQNLDSKDYGTLLTTMFFTDERIRQSWKKAQDLVTGGNLLKYYSTSELHSNLTVNSNTRFRIRLSLPPERSELHSIQWETLQTPDTGRPIALESTIDFARYLSSEDLMPIKTPSQGLLKALIVVANPSDLADYEMDPIDIDGEIMRVKQALSGIQCQTFAYKKEKIHISLDSLRSRLNEYMPHILYLICHGTIIESSPYLFFEGLQGKTQRIQAEAFVNVIRELDHPPLLIVLASCQSAGRSEGNSMIALGPLLSRTGIAAILAMRDNLSMESVKIGLPVFFAELRRHGSIDHALGTARRALFNHETTKDTWSIPVLFLRSSSGLIWKEQALQSHIKWPVILAIVLIIAIMTIKQPSKQMDGDIRIAFPILSAGLPKPDLSEERRKSLTVQLSANLARTLGKAIDDSTLAWSTWGPLELSPINLPIDDTGLLASRINANMVVYGNIGEDNKLGKLTLGLSVLDASADQAGELLGTYYVGEQINYIPPLDRIIASESQVSAEIQHRVELISMLTLGIGILSNTHENADLALADSYFDKALQLVNNSGQAQLVTPGDCPPGYILPQSTLTSTNPRAEATILVLKGNLLSRLNDYDGAIDHYKHAISLSCDYARPYLGIALALMRQANVNRPLADQFLGDQDTQNAYEMSLDTAEKYFDWAEQARWLPENALFTERIFYGRAEWHLLRAVIPTANPISEFEAAHRYYTSLLDLYITSPQEKQNIPILKAIVASAYANRAFTIRGVNPEAALVDLHAGLELEIDSGRRSLWLRRQGEIYLQLNDCVSAIASLRQSLEQAVTIEQRGLTEVLLKQARSQCPTS